MSEKQANTQLEMSKIVDMAIRLALIGMLAYFCLQIISPFVDLIIWGIILATAVYPLYIKLVVMLGNRRRLSATLIVIFILGLLTVPIYQLSSSTAEALYNLATQLGQGTLEIPPPDDSVKDWPVIGEQIAHVWTLASTNMEAAINEYGGQLLSFRHFLISIASGVGTGFLTSIFAIIISGAFMVYADAGYRFTVAFMERVSGNRGREFADLAVKTVRSVALGVIGVAVIQATLSAVGLILIGVPAVGLWVFLVLVLAIAQLPALIVLAPIMVYVFSVNDTIPAIAFMIYGVFVSSSDAILKPLFLGRGMDIPMPVILLGAIGGLIYLGIIGLFTGAVTLAVGYSIFQSWMAVKVEADDANPV